MLTPTCISGEPAPMSVARPTPTRVIRGDDKYCRRVDRLCDAAKAVLCREPGSDDTLAAALDAVYEAEGVV